MHSHVVLLFSVTCSNPTGQLQGMKVRSTTRRDFGESLHGPSAYKLNTSLSSTESTEYVRVVQLFVADVV